MAYLKHEDSNGKAKRAKARKPPSNEGPTKVVLTGPPENLGPANSIQHDINYVRGLDGIEQSLDWIAKGLERLANDERSVSLCTYEGVYPVKITLAEDDTGDTMDRFVSALERIADSVAKLAGLSRPRLERWYEQEEYEPRYRCVASDGGAPGPKTT
jgi:hypothetical protein